MAFSFKYAIKSNYPLIKPITPLIISLAPSMINPTPNLEAAPIEKKQIAAPAHICKIPKPIATKAPKKPLFFFFF
jgi:hypothetical protein